MICQTYTSTIRMKTESITKTGYAYSRGFAVSGRTSVSAGDIVSERGMDLDSLGSGTVFAVICCSGGDGNVR
jgi:hypothetical protein